MRILPGGTAFVAIRETHGPDRPREKDNVHGKPEAVNELVSVDLATGATSVLVTGPDFVGGPWISPDGTRLAWLQWDHPDMPWDTAQLWTAPLRDGGRAIGQAVHVAGGRDAGGRPSSVADALWLDEEQLAFTVDPDGWWNVHIWAGRTVTRVQEEEVESGVPRWVHSAQTLAVTRGRLYVLTLVGGYSHIRRMPDGDPDAGSN
ncbi:MAG TPA: hypothetical protein VMM13_05200, partial [Euzebya sp.]|nr:hypothetical protein [Euzebya sp.]